MGGDLGWVADRYRLERQAGQGGMATVYLATDSATGGRVALKLLEQTGQESLDRFAREAEVLASLHHPAIVRYLSHGTTAEGRPWLAMEWLEGEDLAQRLSRGPLDVADAVVVCARISEALAAAHARGLVHRDVKPANIFLRGGRIADSTLVDFGLARLRQADRQVTRPGLLMGTPGYMAPEQVRRGGDVDARADLFSLGTVLYECLAGQPAFDAPDPVAILLRVLLGDPPPLAALAPHVPAAVLELVERLMDKSRDRRPPSASAVLELLSGAEHPSDVATRSDAITHGELRLQSVVLARLVLPSEGAADTVRLPRAEEVDELLDELHARAALLGGRIDRLLDGSIVGTVGSPVATDLVTAAARLALTLRERLRGWSVTLATGRWQVGPEGPSGDVIDRAVSLPGETEHVRIDDLTAELLDERFELGRDGVGHLLRRERDMFDPQRPVLGRSTPFVGRDRELLGTLGVFEECVSEASTRVVLVMGAAGTGKSRLRRELVQRLLPRAELLLGRAEPLRAEQAFGLLTPIVHRACGLRGTDSPELQRERIVRRVARTVAPDETLAVAEWLGELAGAQFPDAGRPDLHAARLEPVMKGGRIQSAFEQWLAAESARRPVAMILDDLHWADAASIRMIGTTLGRLRDRPVFVLAMARPGLHDRFPDLWRGIATTTIELAPLSDRAAERLVRAVLGPAAPADLVRRLVACGEGHPLLLEELLRATARGETAGAASTAGAVIQARLQALSSEERRALRAASVFGGAFWSGAVDCLLGTSPADTRTRAVLARLAEAELISSRAESRLGGEQEWQFRHDLLRDAAYATLPADDLERAHRRAGEWLESRGEQDAAVLATHFELGRDPDRTAYCHLRASRRALEANDLRGAVGFARKARAGSRDPSVRGSAAVVAAEALLYQGDATTAKEMADGALRDLPAGTDEWFHAVRRRGEIAVRLADGDALRDVISRLVSTADSDSRVAAIARARLFERTLSFRRPDLARELAPFVLGGDATDVAIGDPLVSAHLMFARGMDRMAFGDLSAAYQVFMTVIVEYQRMAHMREHLECRTHEAYLLALIGHIEEALACTDGLRADAERLGFGGLRSYLAAVSAKWLAVAGYLNRAERALQAALGPETSAVRERRTAALVSSARALVEEGRGKYGDAEASARVALDLDPSSVSARTTLASVLLHRGDFEGAGRAAEAVEEIAASLGFLVDDWARSRLIAIRAHHAARRSAVAEDLLQRTQRELRERADRITDVAWRDSFLTAVPQNRQILQGEVLS